MLMWFPCSLQELVYLTMEQVSLKKTAQYLIRVAMKYQRLTTVHMSSRVVFAKRRMSLYAV